MFLCYSIVTYSNLPSSPGTLSPSAGYHYCADMVMHIVDPSLGAMHAGDSFRETTLILKYMLQVYRQHNSSGLHWLIIFPVTWEDLNKLL